MRYGKYEFGKLLAQHGVIDAEAVEDPEGYDGGHLMGCIGKACEEMQKEDVCLWLYHKSKGGQIHPHYDTECGAVRVHKDGDYCPKCAKKIEVVTP